jgi:hypothetical protein
MLHCNYGEWEAARRLLLRVSSSSESRVGLGVLTRGATRAGSRAERRDRDLKIQVPSPRRRGGGGWGVGGWATQAGRSGQVTWVRFVTRPKSRTMRAKRKNVRLGELTERNCPNEQRAGECESCGGEFRIIGADGAGYYHETEPRLRNSGETSEARQNGRGLGWRSRAVWVVPLKLLSRRRGLRARHTINP